MSTTLVEARPVERWGRRPPLLLSATLTPIALALISQPLLHLLPDAVASRLPKPSSTLTFPALQANMGFSILAFLGAVWIVPRTGAAFVGRGLRGRDLCKPGGRTSGPWVPEALGLPLASLYIALLMLFIPFPFSHVFNGRRGDGEGREAFPLSELTLYLSSLLSLLTATLLGFIDDLFDIRWRHKLPIPLIAAIPTLLVYYSEGGLTSVVLPRFAARWLSSLGFNGWVGPRVVDLGFVYYLYLLLVPTFTTNSINILAGINGVETIQALIIAASVAMNDLIFLPVWPHSWLTALGMGNPHEGRLLEWAAGEVVKRHLMSLYFMGPLIGVCLGFLWHNWYPATAFPGDTFCYFTGMAFAAVALQGHFSKTLILFFIPQTFNFLLSCPQLFGLVPCPRHRLPKYDEKTDTLSPSLTLFEVPPPLRTRITLRVLESLQLVKLERSATARAGSSSDTTIISSTNLTLLNFLLVLFGPLHERTLCIVMGSLQASCSLIAFGVRYGLAGLVYGGDRR